MNQLKELGLCGYNQIWESISLVLLKSQKLTVIRKVQASLKVSANKQLKGILSTDRHAVKSTTDGVMLCIAIICPLESRVGYSSSPSSITEYTWIAGEVVKQTLFLSGLYVDFNNMANGLTLTNVFPCQCLSFFDSALAIILSFCLFNNNITSVWSLIKPLTSSSIFVI